MSAKRLTSVGATFAGGGHSRLPLKENRPEDIEKEIASIEASLLNVPADQQQQLRDHIARLKTLLAEMQKS